MANVRIFPLSRSPGRILAIANLIDTAPDSDAAWRRACIDLAKTLFDQGVPDDRVDLELLMLIRAAKEVVARREAARERTATRRERMVAKLALVPPIQGDLFTSSPAEVRQVVSEKGAVDVA